MQARPGPRSDGALRLLPPVVEASAFPEAHGVYEHLAQSLLNANFQNWPAVPMRL